MDDVAMAARLAAAYSSVVSARAAIAGYRVFFALLTLLAIGVQLVGAARLTSGLLVR